MARLEVICGMWCDSVSVVRGRLVTTAAQADPTTPTTPKTAKRHDHDHLAVARHLMARWKGTTTARGYGSVHQKLRAGWKPLVQTGEIMCHAVICLYPTRRIQPGQEWHLGHSADRSGWTGPEHAKCNEADGARRGNRRRGRTRMVAASRQW